jgi:DNA-binding transcriptional LysR family regulator
MSKIDALQVDLNLLRVLNALLDEGSVTRAARRLGVGQPAASHALTRLREIFDDPLFVRVGRRIAPTPRAEALREPLARLLADAARLVRHETGFDARRTRRAFVLVCNDLLASTLPRLTASLQREAPDARLEVTQPRPDDDRALEEGRVDVALLPTPKEGAGLVRRGLGPVTFGVLARRGHPGLGRSRSLLTEEAWAAHPHVMVRTGHGGRSIVGSTLADAGFHRRVGLVVPTFLAALVAVAETDLFFTAPRELVWPLLGRFDLVLLDPPVSMPEVAVAAVWHERYQADSAHRFFRALVEREVSATLAGGATRRRSARKQR